MVRNKRSNIPPGREPTTRPLDSLTPHPLQADLFGDITDVELERLAADIQQRGLQEPIEVTPDGVIIAGHSRVRAARKLGWQSITCIVRHDLAAAGKVAIDEHFVKSNSVRRQLGRLDRVRCAAALIEIRTGRHPNQSCYSREDLKKEVAKEMKMSPRNLNRLLAVLRTPRAVQLAYDRGELTLTEAAHVAELSKKIQQAMADRLAAGESAKEVYAAAQGTHAAAGGIGVLEAYRRIVTALRQYLPAVERAAEDLTAHHTASDGDLLRRAARAMAALASRPRRQ